MADIWAAIKEPVGRKAIEHLEAEAPHWLTKITRKRGRRTERLFWQSGGGYDRNIDHPRTLWTMIDYLHANPVRRGLCIHPTDWKWSSARWYVDRVVDPDLPPLKVNAEWFDTSDVAHSPT